MLHTEAGLSVPFYIGSSIDVKVQSTTHKKFGERIKQLRKELNMTQEELAFRVGVDRSYMGFVERGEKNPTLKNIIKIAKTLKVSLSDLFRSI